MKLLLHQAILGVIVPDPSSGIAKRSSHLISFWFTEKGKPFSLGSI